VGELVAALSDRAVPSGQQPVHRALRGQVAALVEQRRPHRRGRAVHEPLGVQFGEHGLALGLAEREHGRLARLGLARRRGLRCR
jgi:hypothetical protein